MSTTLEQSDSLPSQAIDIAYHDVGHFSSPFSGFAFPIYRPFRPIKKFFYKLVQRSILWFCSKIEAIAILDKLILKSELPNFFKVSDDLYRGGQPLTEGFLKLKQYNVKTIINLRVVDTDHLLSKDTGLEVIHLSFKPHIPKESDVVAFLKTVLDVSKQPVYLHCYHGSDRTGLMCAVYRIFVQGWSREDAIYEMIHGGYGFHTFFQQNLVSFLKKLDIDSIKSKLLS